MPPTPPCCALSRRTEPSDAGSARHKAGAVSGLPSHLLAGLWRTRRMGAVFNDLVASREVKAPSSSAAFISTPGRWLRPTRRPSACAMARCHRWLAPALNALINAVEGRAGFSPSRRERRHRQVDPCRMVIVADGTRGLRTAAAGFTRSQAGVVRHADAGYEIAVNAVAKWGSKSPCSPGEPWLS